MKEKKVSFKKQLEYMIRAGFACAYIQTHEEDRTLKVIKEVCDRLGSTLYRCDIEGKISIFEDPNVNAPFEKKVESADLIFPTFAGDEFKERNVLAVLDFQFIIDGPPVIRAIKNNLTALRRDGKIVLVVGPRLPIPDELSKDIAVLDFPLPDRDELRKYLDFVIESASEGAAKPLKVEAEHKDAVVDAALGLTSQEAEDAFSLAIAKNQNLNGDSIKVVMDQKCQVLKKDGLLEYFEPQETMDDIGGLENLKRWLVTRKAIFSETARDFGLPAPKGMLLVGISGCGKSLTAKAMASNWQIPLIRFDVGKVFQKMMGESESNIRKAIKVAEALAPCIFWLDEGEKGLSGAKASGELDSGVTARVIGTLLTWMQEKTSPVFVAMTANDVSKLPPELLRKGRFDEIFFVDLPNKDERIEIIKIMLRKFSKVREARGIHKAIQMTDADIAKILLSTERKDVESGQKLIMNGAEIEQAVISGLSNAFADGKRDLTADDVSVALTSFVPLSKTMEAEIAALREWGKARARKASVEEKLGEGKPAINPFMRKITEAPKSAE